MMEIPLIDEFREIRRRLAEACEGDVGRYTEMLRQKSRINPERYVTKPLSPPAPFGASSEPSSE